MGRKLKNNTSIYGEQIMISGSKTINAASASVKSQVQAPSPNSTTAITYSAVPVFLLGQDINKLVLYAEQNLTKSRFLLVNSSKIIFWLEFPMNCRNTGCTLCDCYG